MGYFNSTVSNSMCIVTTEEQPLWPLVLQFLIQIDHSFVSTHIYVHIHDKPLPTECWFLSIYHPPCHHTFPPILKVNNLHLVGGWMCISSIQKFWKRETATAFQPSINARLHPPLLDRNWVVVAFAGGAWEVKSTASEWGCWARHTHTPTQQLLLLFLSIAPPSEGERLFQRWTDSAAQGLKDNFTNYFLN